MKGGKADGRWRFAEKIFEKEKWDRKYIFWIGKLGNAFIYYYFHFDIKSKYFIFNYNILNNFK